MSNNDLVSKTLMDTLLSRRSFMKWSAAIGGTAAVAGGMGLSSLNAVAADAPVQQSGGKWVVAACWHNCGGRCLNQVYVVDGVVSRQKTDDKHVDSPDFPQQRGCARGRAQRHQVFGADRLKYPMKRKHWAPGGGDKSLRGRDEWERISWDEALDIVASEMQRIKDAYGNTSIVSTGSEIARTLGLFGGYVSVWGSSSTGTWNMTSPAIGVQDAGKCHGSLTDRLTLRKSKLVVMWSANPAWSQAGNPAYHLLQVKNAGAKFIFVDPFYSPTAQALADEWISNSPWHGYHHAAGDGAHPVYRRRPRDKSPD